MTLNLLLIENVLTYIEIHLIESFLLINEKLIEQDVKTLKNIFIEEFSRKIFEINIINFDIELTDLH